MNTQENTKLPEYAAWAAAKWWGRELVPEEQRGEFISVLARKLCADFAFDPDNDHFNLYASAYGANDPLRAIMERFSVGSTCFKQTYFYPGPNILTGRFGPFAADTAFVPMRLKRERRAGWRMPPNAVYVGRPSKWGNLKPEKVAGKWVLVGPTGVYANRELKHYKKWDTREEAVAFSLDNYREWAEGQLRDFYEPLIGHNLMCWCKYDQPCHADILIDVIQNRGYSPYV